MPPTPKKGRMARPRTTMPRPPSQWVRLRQKRMPGATISTFWMIEAPVVVKPEVVSKMQSARWGITPER
jgi:hypothetical protein